MTGRVMEVIVWAALGIFVIAGKGPVILDPVTFATEAECLDLQRRAAEFALTQEEVVGVGQRCVQITVKSQEVAPKPQSQSVPRMSTPKPGFEIQT